MAAIAMLLAAQFVAVIKSTSTRTATVRVLLCANDAILHHVFERVGNVTPMDAASVLIRAID